MRFLKGIYFYFTHFDIRLTYFSSDIQKPPPILLTVDSCLEIDYIINSLYFLFGSLKTTMVIYIHCDTCIRMPHDVLQCLDIHSCGCKQGNNPVCLKICADRCGMVSSGCALLYAFSIFSKKLFTAFIANGCPLPLTNTKLLYRPLLHRSVCLILNSAFLTPQTPYELFPSWE